MDDTQRGGTQAGQVYSTGSVRWQAGQEKERERERDERCGAAQGVYIGAARGVGEEEKKKTADWIGRGGRGEEGGSARCLRVVAETALPLWLLTSLRSACCGCGRRGSHLDSPLWPGFTRFRSLFLPFSSGNPSGLHDSSEPTVDRDGFNPTADVFPIYFPLG